jgi:bacterioferritin-associated ferredoxin
MYACICRAVTVNEVEDAIDAGAETVEQIGCATRAGTSCTTCHDHLEEIIEAKCGVCPLASRAVA